ncbi:MAG TPA: segregation/condensation protein A [Thermodesulfobacteriota bacterium]|nr:segregation/condensation protein A [Thermodesulfobacteriota bacterium]
MSYKVKLDIFEGPLDLLLYLIKKNEVDIYDIPVSVITEEYLKYIDAMKSMNLELAGEFLLMAATLIHIKSKMLLPLPEEGEEEEEGADPRAELMRRLIEYRRFKAAADELYARNLLGRDVFGRGMPFFSDEPEDEEPLEAGLTDVTLFDLLGAFTEILKRAPKTYHIDITVDRFKVQDKINYIMDFLTRAKSMTFREFFPSDAVKGEVIVTFLAILELAKLCMISLNQTEDGTIRVYCPSPGGFVASEGEASPQA